MSLEKYFCSSPWFHMRIQNDGTYDYCRWSDTKHQTQNDGINTKPVEVFFQNNLSDLRKRMLNGEYIESCKNCYKMEEHHKLSGRQKQLLKTGIQLDNFTKTVLSSPWKPVFSDSQTKNGRTDQLPQDWQIDLGNHCNSACVFCHPKDSSRLATEFKKIGLIKELPRKNWSTDPEQLDNFFNFLSQSEKLCYLHFIGGETLITPGFKSILEKLVASKLNSKLTIGFTTNLTEWRPDIIDLLKFFDVHVGLSIECLHPVNDYVRYGGKYDRTLSLLDRWVKEGKQNNWIVSVRTTPTLLTILHLTTVYDYCFDNDIFIESCNFINEPSFLRPSVLPRKYRLQVLEKIISWIDKHPIQVIESKVLNNRNATTVKQQIIEDIFSYKNYLEQEQDESHLLPAMVNYLKTLESNRQNSILDYLPEYEELFRTVGY